MIYNQIVTWTAFAILAMFYFSMQARDDLVIKLVRKFQGEVLKRIRGRIYQKKYDQRSYLT